MARVTSQSSYFARALFHDVNPANAQRYGRNSKDLFTQDSEQSFVEVFYPLPSSRAFGSSLEWQYERILNEKGFEYISEVQRQHSTLYFIRNRHSQSPLSIQAHLFDHLLEHTKAFPRFKDFVLAFGRRRGEHEIGPSQLKFNPIQSPTGPAFECAYGLRFVEWNGRGSYQWDGLNNYKTPYSVRQSAIYNRHNSNGTSTWILITTSKLAESRLKDYLILQSKDQSDPFEPHILLVDCALANWREYLVWLNKITNDQVNRYVVADITTKEESKRIRPNFDERQKLKLIEDHVLDIFVALDSTNDTVKSLLKHHEDWRRNAKNVVEDKGPDLVQIALAEKLREIALYRLKVNSLHEKVKGTIQLLSSLLELDNGHALKELAEEARKDNIAIRSLTEKSTRDAAAVKVLTVITLIYLPASAVANFFSTQLIQQEHSESTNSYHLVLADNFYMFWAVAVPLTLFTLFVWWGWVKMQRRSEEVGRVSKRNFETIGRRPWSQRQRNLQISKSDPEGNPHSKSTGVSHLSNVDPTERQTTLTRLSNDIVVRERDGQVSIIID